VAHLGAYGFRDEDLFGLFYYIFRDLTGREWASPEPDPRFTSGARRGRYHDLLFRRHYLSVAGGMGRIMN